VLLNRFGAFMRCAQLQFGGILYSKNVSIFMVEFLLMAGAAAIVKRVLNPGACKI
jgi:hypothetical protein